MTLTPAARLDCLCYRLHAFDFLRLMHPDMAEQLRQARQRSNPYRP